MNRLLGLLIIIGLLSSCDEPTDTLCDDIPPDEPTLTDSTDYELFNLLVQDIHSANFIHIVQQTDTIISNSMNLEDWLIHNQIAYDNQTINNYIENNRQIYILSYNQLKLSEYIIHREELNCLSGRDESGWNGYYEKYPDSFGYFVFSRPGYDLKKKSAILEYSWYGGSLAGEGYLVKFEKVGDNWVLTDHVVTWLI